MSDFLIVLSSIIEIPVLNANSVDPDQTPRSVASELGLYCLSMSFLWDTRHKWADNQNLLKFKIKPLNIFVMPYF